MTGKSAVTKLSAKKKIKPLDALLTAAAHAAALMTFSAAAFILLYVLVKGVPNLRPSLFAWTYTYENPSFIPPLITTVMMTVLTLLICVPVGVSAAIYLVEYASRSSRVVRAVRITAETLAGIPSIVYGLFGSIFFVTFLGWGWSLLAGACTLAIMILPLVMRSTEEALKAVPDAYREGSFGLGAGRLRTIFTLVLPSAVPGILAGVILGIGRIVGETAALIYTSGTAPKVPESLLSSGRTLSLHLYSLSREALRKDEAYATAVILVVLVFAVNALSARIAKKLAAPKY